MVLGLNTVCDVYFAGAIDLLCDAWDLTPDVAGVAKQQRADKGTPMWGSAIRFQATWMAAGGSAPEFFTSIIGATMASPLMMLLYQFSSEALL